jgi:hypothetical protein
MAYIYMYFVWLINTNMVPYSEANLGKAWHTLHWPEGGGNLSFTSHPDLTYSTSHSVMATPKRSILWTLTSTSPSSLPSRLHPSG